MESMSSQGSSKVKEEAEEENQSSVTIEEEQRNVI